MTWLPSQKHGDGVLRWMATSSSEGIGKEKESVGWLCVLGTALIV